MIIPVNLKVIPQVFDCKVVFYLKIKKAFVKALPKNLPDFIKADISTLNLNDKITMKI